MNLRDGDKEYDEGGDAMKADVDPFSCASLETPSTFDLVDRITKEFVDEWRELDDRKIPARTGWSTNGGGSEQQQDDDEPKRMPRWYERSVRLPDKFDYAGKAPRKREDEYDEGEGEDRVLSLDDPTKTTSYRMELENMFDRVPTAEMLLDAELPLPTNMSKLQDEISAGSIDFRYNAMMRLRMSDRHEYPPAPPSSRRPGKEYQVDDIMVATIRFECWRRCDVKIGRNSIGAE